MTQKDMKKLYAQIAQYIYTTKGCRKCGPLQCQMCASCFAQIRHNLPLTKEQQQNIRPIEYGARKYIFNRLLIQNMVNVVYAVLCFSTPFLIDRYKIESGFLQVCALILGALSYIMALGILIQFTQLFVARVYLKRYVTLEEQREDWTERPV